MVTTAPEPTAGRPAWVHLLRVLALIAVATAAVVVLHDKLPSPREIGAALGSANWWWVTGALALQLASIGMLIRQQRRLLGAFGVTVRLRTVAAITYSSNAISLTLPAGSAVGAGYSYRQYRRSGAAAGTAAAVLLLSGLMSLSALVLLYLLGFGLAAALRLLREGTVSPMLVVFGGFVVLVTVTALVAQHHRFSRAHRYSRLAGRLRDWAQRHPRVEPVVDGILQTGRQARKVGRRDWRLAMITSIGNWLFDVASLYASCLAFDISVNIFEVALIYIGIQLVRQIPLTPGGIGVIEASLLAALIATGAATGPASAAVLLYRLCSAWLLVPIGYVMLGLLRRRRPESFAVGGG